MSYSQNNEEIVILNRFKGEVGTFLDLGSFTGIELSNVRALADLGWGGVMVEASPTVFEKLVNNYRNYPKIDCYNVGIGMETKKMSFFDNHQAVGTLHKHETERWGETQQFNEIEIQCVEINEFLTWPIHKTFEMISIDIEGYDLEVAKRMDFVKLGAILVVIEWNSKDRHLYDEIFLPIGFSCIHVNSENLIYTRP